ncbi:MAG: rhomboid family intramembrane serine protease [Rhizobiaceae bacterium]|nr:rhomboid family intramembrane serine protease [Rhizobiaceae bacterium]
MENDNLDKNPPIFNLPPVIFALTIILIAVHLVKTWLVPDAYFQDFMLLLAAIPARYGELGSQLPYGFAAWYTPLSYAFIHADWTHLSFNVLWMLAFGSPVALRFGTVRFLALAAAGTLAGFAFHLFTHANDLAPMIGASGAVSAFMGAAIRLNRDVEKPVLGLIESFRNRGFVAFILIWFGFNLLVGLQPELIAGEGVQIAWQAHVGGFLTGLLAFRLFDPLRNLPQSTR